MFNFGFGWGYGFMAVIQTFVCGVVALLAFAVAVGLIFLLVRFLLVATRAAQLYLAEHEPSRPVAPAASATPAASTTPTASTTPAAATPAAKTPPATTSAAATATPAGKPAAKSRIPRTPPKA